jgi:hypothetical protein
MLSSSAVLPRVGISVFLQAYLVWLRVCRNVHATTLAEDAMNFNKKIINCQRNKNARRMWLSFVFNNFIYNNNIKKYYDFMLIFAPQINTRIRPHQSNRV